MTARIPLLGHLDPQFVDDENLGALAAEDVRLDASSFSNNLDAMTVQVQLLAVKVDELQASGGGDLGPIMTQIAAIQADITNLTSQIGSNDTDISSLQTRLTTLETTVNGISRCYATTTTIATNEGAGQFMANQFHVVEMPTANDSRSLAIPNVGVLGDRMAVTVLADASAVLTLSWTLPVGGVQYPSRVKMREGDILYLEKCAAAAEGRAAGWVPVSMIRQDDMTGGGVTAFDGNLTGSLVQSGDRITLGDATATTPQVGYVIFKNAFRNAQGNLADGRLVYSSAGTENPGNLQVYNSTGEHTVLTDASNDDQFPSFLARTANIPDTSGIATNATDIAANTALITRITAEVQALTNRPQGTPLGAAAVQFLSHARLEHHSQFDTSYQGDFTGVFQWNWKNVNLRQGSFQSGGDETGMGVTQSGGIITGLPTEDTFDASALTMVGFEFTASPGNSQVINEFHHRGTERGDGNSQASVFFMTDSAGRLCIQRPGAGTTIVNGQYRRVEGFGGNVFFTPAAGDIVIANPLAFGVGMEVEVWFYDASTSTLWNCNNVEFSTAVRSQTEITRNTGGGFTSAQELQARRVFSTHDIESHTSSDLGKVFGFRHTHYETHSDFYNYINNHMDDPFLYIKHTTDSSYDSPGFDGDLEITGDLEVPRKVETGTLQLGNTELTEAKLTELLTALHIPEESVTRTVAHPGLEYAMVADDVDKYVAVSIQGVVGNTARLFIIDDTLGSNGDVMFIRNAGNRNFNVGHGNNVLATLEENEVVPFAKISGNWIPIVNFLTAQAGGLSQTQVDARITTLVEQFARDTTTRLAKGKLPTDTVYATTTSRISTDLLPTSIIYSNNSLFTGKANLTDIAEAARSGNTGTRWSKDKLPTDVVYDDDLPDISGKADTTTVAILTSDLAGNGGKFPKVNAAGDDIEYVDAPSGGSAGGGGTSVAYTDLEPITVTLEAITGTAAQKADKLQGTGHILVAGREIIVEGARDFVSKPIRTDDILALTPLTNDTDATTTAHDLEVLQYDYLGQNIGSDGQVQIFVGRKSNNELLLLIKVTNILGQSIVGNNHNNTAKLFYRRVMVPAGGSPDFEDVDITINSTTSNVVSAVSSSAVVPSGPIGTTIDLTGFVAFGGQSSIPQDFRVTHFTQNGGTRGGFTLAEWNAVPNGTVKTYAVEGITWTFWKSSATLLNIRHSGSSSIEIPYAFQRSAPVTSYDITTPKDVSYDVHASNNEIYDFQYLLNGIVQVAGRFDADQIRGLTAIAENAAFNTLTADNSMRFNFYTEGDTTTRQRTFALAITSDNSMLIADDEYLESRDGDPEVKLRKQTGGGGSGSSVPAPAEDDSLSFTLGNGGSGTPTYQHLKSTDLNIGTTADAGFIFRIDGRELYVPDHKLVMLPSTSSNGDAYSTSNDSSKNAVSVSSEEIDDVVYRVYAGKSTAAGGVLNFTLRKIDDSTGTTVSTDATSDAKVYRYAGIADVKDDWAASSTALSASNRVQLPENYRNWKWLVALGPPDSNAGNISFVFPTAELDHNYNFNNNELRLNGGRRASWTLSTRQLSLENTAERFQFVRLVD